MQKYVKIYKPIWVFNMIYSVPKKHIQYLISSIIPSNELEILFLKTTSDLLPAYQKAIIRWLFCMRGLPRVFIRIRAWLFAVDPSGPVD